MTANHKHDNPILVTGAAGAVGGIGRNLTDFLLARGHKVRALVRREDQRAEALRRLGAEVVEGDLTDLASMHRAVEGCRRIYFGMSVSPAYLEATVNTAAVARHYGVEAFVNMCSAMPTSKVRSGNALLKMSTPVPDGIAAVMATILSSFCASLTRLWPNTFW